eukprot:CAMPEP_0203955224 /NCGR_PEP_ID=MMETSP0359-20131031/87937_1 /ASSEMBLY_ACC=CAM_ASM_000338 /TAXON_ID=268821 /ORGANISM="Scrippsiella Hangoei, Strain SHTV-5" /LENGTH=124 /DNA_ID=CAMNT_0050888825 /DNA_START=157 /DNA_END=528 /DNA_ORIENTATION=-
MEFERALFRIHSRALTSEVVRKVLHQSERLLPWLLVSLCFCWALLHEQYVGRARCLPAALQHARLWNYSAGGPALPEDAMLFLTVTAGDDLLDTGITLHMRPAPATDAGAPLESGVGAPGRFLV